MSFDKLLQELKEKKYKPVYFLQGEEPYFTDEISDYIGSHVLDEGEQDFNQKVMYGKEIEIQDILNECKQFPMMASHRVVIVKEAQELSRTIIQMHDYFTNPTETTILVVCYKYKKVDGKTKMAKELKKSGYSHTFDKIRDYKMPEWIIAEGKKKGLTVAPNAALLLAEYLGENLSKVVKTFAKLQIVMEGETLIDEKTVAKHVGISREYNVFALQKALSKKDVLKANLIANHFGNNPKNYPLVVTIATLYGYFSKLLKYHFLVGKLSEKDLARQVGTNPYFLKDFASAARNYPKGKLAKIITYLRDADMKSKGVGISKIDSREILVELVFMILH